MICRTSGSKRANVGLRDAEPEILFQVKVRNQYGEPDQNDSDRDEEFVQIAVFDFLHRFVLGGVFCRAGYFQPGAFSAISEPSGVTSMAPVPAAVTCPITSTPSAKISCCFDSGTVNSSS